MVSLLSLSLGCMTLHEQLAAAPQQTPTDGFLCNALTCSTVPAQFRLSWRSADAGFRTVAAYFLVPTLPLAQACLPD